MVLDNSLSTIVERLNESSMQMGRGIDAGNFIYVVNPGATLLDPRAENHIPGASVGDMVLQNFGIHLGPSVQATLLSVREVYAEYKPKDSIPVARWDVDDAERLESLAERKERMGGFEEEEKGDKFVRVTSGGNVLHKNILAAIYLNGTDLAPIYKKAILIFKAHGLKEYNDLLKQLVKFSSANKPEDIFVTSMLRFRITTKEVKTEKGGIWYPHLQKIPKTNFSLTRDDEGKITLSAGSGFLCNEAQAELLLNEANEMDSILHSPAFTKTPQPVIEHQEKALEGLKKKEVDNSKSFFDVELPSTPPSVDLPQPKEPAKTIVSEEDIPF